MTELRSWFSRHWKASGLIVVAALALVSSVYAYWKTSTPSASSPATSMVTSYPLELRTELNETEFQQGALIAINLSIRNISNRTVELSFPSSYRLDFDVIDEDGNVVYRWSRGKGWLYMVLTYTLEPGEEFGLTLKQHIKDAYDPYNQPVYNKVPLPKGTYTVEGYTATFGAIYKDNNQPTGISAPLRTPAIIIVVK